MNMWNLLVNYSRDIHGQIFGTNTRMHTLREETFANNIFAVYGFLCKKFAPQKQNDIMKNVMNVMKNSSFQKKRTTGHVLQKFVLQNCFWINESQKQGL